MDDVLLYFSVKYDGDFKSILKALESREKIDLIELEKIKRELKDNFITLLDKRYPTKLKQLNNPPFVLYYKGDISLLEKDCIAVVGSRNNSEYGEKMVNKIVPALSKKYVIVSGLAKGIDSLAHLSCLNQNGKTIAILGNGTELYYPTSNKELQNKIAEVGLLISEYPYFSKPKKEKFPMRNRIIAGLSKGVVVVESKIKSGSMITVEHILNLGREVFCVPSSALEESGCNYLIKNGAVLVETAKDILEVL